MGKTFRFNDDYGHKKKKKFKIRRDKRQKVFEDRHVIEDKSEHERDDLGYDNRDFRN
jgi:hypothetical protein